MPAAPVDTYTVALEGFSAFERTALASFFRLAARRSPAYVQVAEAGMSDFLIADADHPASLAAVLRHQRTGDTVFVGKSAPAGALAWLPRPIDPMHIVRELDTLVELRLAPPSAASGAVPAGTAAIAAMDLSRLDEDTVDLLLPEADEAFQAAALAASPIRSAAPVGRGGAQREVLVVEDSAIARKFLQLRLQRLGYRVQTSPSGEDALDVLEHHWFAIVFADVVLGPPGSAIDGLRVCQHIKQRAAQPGGKPTAVVLVTSLTGSSDRVRGSLAGCDAYLTKPLLEADFIAALKVVDPAFEWSSEAAAASV